MSTAVHNNTAMSAAYRKSGILPTNNRPTYSVIVVPKVVPSPPRSAGVSPSHQRSYP